MTIADARALLGRKAKSFAIASRLLPADVRDDAARVYAFCRHVDDLADDHRDDAALAAIDAELRGHRRARPVVSELLGVAYRRGLPTDAARALVAGVRGDLEPVRIADDTALLRYAWSVAGTVGLLMAPLLGATERAARAFAVDLGVAMQLTNIARDVAEDAANGRVYLPETRLRAAGVAPEALLRGEADRDAVATVVRDVLALAEVWYRSAEDGLGYLPWRGRLAATVALEVYRGIGRKLLARGGDALGGRTVLGGLQRVGLALRAVVRTPWATRRGRHDAMLHGPLRGLNGAEA